MKYYISDCHFSHSNLLTSMDNRPFSNVEEMNEYMIEKWTSKVKGHDEVFILGDLMFGNPQEAQKLLNRLKGKLHLIIGNHDGFARKQSFNKERFRDISTILETNDNNRKVVLCHYPLLFYPGQFQRNEKGESKTYMLYGHVHNTFDEKLINQFLEIGSKTPRPIMSGETIPTPFNLINVFCMFSDYTPLSLDEWIEVDKKRRAALL